MLEPSQAAMFVMAVAYLLSLIAILATCVRLFSGKPLLEYEPRQRVPWGGLAALISLLFVLLPWIFEQDSQLDPNQYIWSTLLNSVVLIGFTLFILACLRIFSDADAHDLGLPMRPRQLASDVGIGCLACLASLLPVHAIHLLLNVIFEPEQQHELIEMLIENRSPLLMLAGALAAVVVAPLFEEVIFRLMLQGWLERVEDERLDFRSSERESSVPQILEETEQENPSHQDPPHQNPTPQGPVFSYTDLPVNGVVPQNEDLGSDHASTERESRAPLFGLPHGWMPVLISGTAFGLAHLGHGVSAFPLVFFGIVLGYLYQRTHRLAPCIAAHMLFNAYTMGLLWLS
jgi:membrane protease YdiL (CAAX protease family)